MHEGAGESSLPWGSFVQQSATVRHTSLMFEQGGGGGGGGGSPGFGGGGGGGGGGSWHLFM